MDPIPSHRPIKSSNTEAYDVSDALLIVKPDETLTKSLIILWNKQITNLCKDITCMIQQSRVEELIISIILKLNSHIIHLILPSFVPFTPVLICPQSLLRSRICLHHQPARPACFYLTLLHTIWDLDIHRSCLYYIFSFIATLQWMVASYLESRAAFFLSSID